MAPWTIRVERSASGLTLRRAGRGHVLMVLIHGFAVSGAMFDPLLRALAFIPESAARLEVVAIDLPGMGDSEWTARHASDPIGMTVQGVTEAVEGLSEGRPIMWVGHSIGAHVAALCAAQMADRSIGFGSLEGNLSHKDGALSNESLDHQSAEPFRRAVVTRLADLGRQNAPLRPLAGMAAQANAEALQHLGRALSLAASEGSLPAAFETLEFPKRYWLNPSNRSKETVAYLREAAIEVVIIAGASHWPSLDRVDALSKSLSEWVVGVLNEG